MVGLRNARESKTLAWGFAMAPHRLRALVSYYLILISYYLILISYYLILIFVPFDLILYVPSTIFQLCRDGSSWVEPVLS